MPVTKLKRVKIRNWLKIKETELEFPEVGLVLLTGSNLAANGALESVGAGKTSLGEAISKAVAAVDGRYTNAGHYSTDEAGDTLIEVELDHGGQPLVVQYGYKCQELSRTGEGLKFRLGDQEVWRDHVRSTREELSRTINVTPELANWTVFIDGERLKFSQLPQRDLVDLLLASLGQPPWTRYHEQSKLVMAKFKADAEQAGARRKRGATSVVDTEKSAAAAAALLARELKIFSRRCDEHAETCRTLAEKTEAAQVEVARLEARRSAISKELKEIERLHADEYHKLEVQRGQIKRKIKLAGVFKDKRLETKTNLRGELGQARRQLREMESTPTDCPSCGKPWDKKHAKSEIEKQLAEVHRQETAFQITENLYASVDRDLRIYEGRLIKLESRLQELKVDEQVCQLSRESESISETRLPTAYAKAAGLKLFPGAPSREAVAAAEAVLAERSGTLTAARADLAEAGRAQVETETAMKVVGYWTEAYSPTGIPNMVLRRSLGPLNETSKRLSNLLTGGTIEISYNTARELASGKDRPELVINVKNKLGSRRVEGNSKGEAGMTDLIISETLSEVGRVAGRLGYRWYDEVVKTQDPVVRRSVFAYLRETARRLGILIFIVDHSTEVGAYADYVLLAEKTAAGGTSFRWV